MKILYITVPSYFDLEVSLIRELSKFVEISVLLIVSPQSLKSSAFSINHLSSQCDIISASDCEEMQKYKDIIDTKKWFIANNPDNSLLSCIKLSSQIKRFIKKNHFDLLHTTSCCKTLFFLTLFYFLFPKTLLTVHDPIPHGKISLFENIFRRKLFFHANKNLLFLSKALLIPFCKKYGIKEDRIHFSRLSVYDILTRYSIGENAYGNYILFFGRIEPYKGVDLLIEAFEKSELPLNGVKLVIAGKGNISHNNHNLSNNVITINRFIENDELATLISHCKYVVLPYLTATQSGCVMSAYAFNKPVLATDVGDFPLTIEDKKTGWICKANDEKKLCNALNDLNSINLSDMERNIREKYQENGIFSWSCIAQKLAECYENL